MDLKLEKTLAYYTLAILFVIGVVCYAAFAHKSQEEPIRILFECTAGNVLFDHKVHTSEDGYGFGCADCHHTWEEDEGEPEACGECHDVDGEDALKRSDAFHQQCLGCHQDDGTAPTECSACHAF